jgi:hypothetical protein
MSSSTDQSDDFNDITVAKHAIGVSPAGDDLLVDLHGARPLGQASGCQQGFHGTVRGQVDFTAIDDYTHVIIIDHTLVYTTGFDAMPRHFLNPISLLPVLAVILIQGCSRPDYDTSTPEAALDSAQKMVQDGNAEYLVDLIHIEPRDISFDDGVTEASAIGEVKGKLAELFGRLWTVATLLQEQFPDEVAKETDTALAEVEEENREFGDIAGRILANPFLFIDSYRDRVEVMDLGDGTAAVLYEDEPVFGGFLAMTETDEGWKFAVPTELVQTSEYWPQTRWEWSVVASMLLGIENSLEDFENEIRGRRFRSLDHAAERAGRFIGESVVVQGVIYAMMKNDGDSDSED